jgi:hypothetical protein
MRFGQNPAKSLEHVAQPKKITLAIVTYIPSLSGYFSESLDILKNCLESIWQNTDLPYDLLVFDNASCPEATSYLREAQRQGRIQFLVLSEKNIGKGGAWNFIFGAASGEFIAYADCDVHFHPGWLSAQVALFDLFPKLGMVTGTPLRVPEEFSTSTIQWAQDNPNAALQRGRLLPWEDYWKHAHSLGIETEEEGRKLYEANEDVCLIYAGKRYYIGAAHYQFVARRKVLQGVLPIPSDRPMGQVRSLDIAINQQGYLRLSTPEWWVEHMGNHIETNPARLVPARAQTERKGRGFSQVPIVRRSLLKLYDRIFRLYFSGG